MHNVLDIACACAYALTTITYNIAQSRVTISKQKGGSAAPHDPPWPDHLPLVPFAHTNAYLYSFVPHTTSLWNLLPDECISVSSVRAFKVPFNCVGVSVRNG